MKKIRQLFDGMTMEQLLEVAQAVSRMMARYLFDRLNCP